MEDWFNFLFRIFSDQERTIFLPLIKNTKSVLALATVVFLIAYRYYKENSTDMKEQFFLSIYAKRH